MKSSIAIASAVAAALAFSFVADLAVPGAIATASAAARDAKTYTVKFTEVANSCESTGVSLSTAKMEIAPVGKKRGLSVSIQMIPVMKGRAGKKGKFSARAKKGKTAIAGLDGKFAVSGTIAAGKVDIIFIAEYFKGKTPLCTTSWKGKS